ncbi:MAG: hypothetical protein F2667_10255, partial [Actinobacteria bacterium]|nr:hypothetical protein [Actinomycetota bacterium]
GHELPAAGDVRDLDVVMIAAPTVVGLDRVMMLRDLGRHVALLSYGWDRGGLAIEPVRSSGIRRFVHLSSTQDELRSALGAVIGATPSTAETVSWEHPDLARLSDRESDVLALLCRGYSNQQIAAELYLTVNTVKTYIRGAYRKMGVSRRAQAVVWGLERGVGAAYAGESSA